MVLVYAQQHGNEPSGKEGALALALELARGTTTTAPGADRRPPGAPGEPRRGRRAPAGERRRRGPEPEPPDPGRPRGGGPPGPLPPVGARGRRGRPRVLPLERRLARGRVAPALGRADRSPHEPEHGARDPAPGRGGGAPAARGGPRGRKASRAQLRGGLSGAAPVVHHEPQRRPAGARPAPHPLLHLRGEAVRTPGHRHGTPRRGPARGHGGTSPLHRRRGGRHSPGGARSATGRRRRRPRSGGAHHGPGAGRRRPCGSPWSRWRPTPRGGGSWATR
jgi:hypothetical protein